MKYEDAEQILTQLMAGEQKYLVCRDCRAVVTDSPEDNDRVLSSLLGEEEEVTEQRRACV